MRSFTDVIDVFFVFLRLGLISFGGPVAHLGYFHEAFVRSRKWISENQYADIVALCQVLPGPTSSQVGFTIGLNRAGFAGGIAAWLAFTLPSALLMTALVFAFDKFQFFAQSGVMHGLKLAAIAVIAHAFLEMAKSLCPDTPRRLFAGLVALLLLLSTQPFAQLIAILAGGIFGIAVLNESAAHAGNSLSLRVDKKVSVFCVCLLLAGLFLLPVISQLTGLRIFELADKFFRSGSLVFGGGHVVLPLLSAEFVESGMVDKEIFMAGYGAAQAIPGPLFSFATYLGAAAAGGSGSAAILASSVSLISVFLPAFLILYAVLPLWRRFTEFKIARRALTGMNSAVVGLLLAALLSALKSDSLSQVSDYGIIVLSFVFLQYLKLPSWLVVVSAAGLEALRVGLLT